MAINLKTINEITDTIYWPIVKDDLLRSNESLIRWGMEPVLSEEEIQALESSNSRKEYIEKMTPIWEEQKRVLYQEKGVYDI